MKTLHFLLLVLFTIGLYFGLASSSLAQVNINPCQDGQAPPGCYVSHTVSLSCQATEVYESGVFIGWDVNIAASTYPPAPSNLSGFGTYQISDNTDYTDARTYRKFIPASFSDPKPTFDFTAGVTQVWHLGASSCNQVDSTPPGGTPVPSGSITASPNPCQIPSGASSCTSFIDWQTANVNSAKVFVSSNGGPESLFSSQDTCLAQACPYSSITGSPDYYTFRLYDYSSGFREALLDSVRVTGERSSPPDKLPVGNFDSAECTATGGSITGWTYDPDVPNVSIGVQVYRDGPKGQGGILVGEYKADQPRADVNQSFGILGNHGFTISPLPDVFRDGQLHYVYIYGVNINSAAPNTLLAGSGRPLQCPGAGVCPNSANFRVVLADGVIRVGGKTLAIAPSGWTGGKFVSSSGVARVGTVTGSTAEVLGDFAGTTTIFGSGWVADNGATGCNLGASLLSVEAAPLGKLSADPNIVNLCIGETSGSTTVTAEANTYAEVRIFGAEGIPDGQVLFTLLAFEKKSVLTGKWVKQGTSFKLVAPFDNNQELASITLNIKQAACDLNAPKVDLKAVNPDGSLTDGPVSVSLGGNVDLKWESSNTKSCKALGGWSSSTAVTGQGNTGAVFGSKTFTVECLGSVVNTTVQDSVTINVIIPVNGPSVDLKALNPDGSKTDGPVSIKKDGAVTLVWTSTNTQSCLATGGWTASQAISGSEAGIAVASTKTFEIVCQGTQGGEARDTVQVIVGDCPVGQSCGSGSGGSVNSNVYNSASAVNAGLSAPCGQILATWDKPTGPVDGFRMYYFNETSKAWERLWELSYSASKPIDSSPGAKFYYRFTPPGNELSKLFRYRVYTFLGDKENLPSQDAFGSPLATVWPCTSDFNGSNKDIIRVRNINLPYDLQQNQDSKIGAAVPIIERDEITFSINILNSGEVPYTGEILVDDDMSNLAEPIGGWKVRVDCDGECTSKTLPYNKTTRRMSFILTPKPGQSLAAGGVEVWTVVFTAMAKAENTTNAAFRFQNIAYINGSTSPLLKTPRILVLPVGSPTIKEIQ